jgi:hypothetical protein
VTREIAQDLRLKVIPINAVVRVLGGRVGTSSRMPGRRVDLEFRVQRDGEVRDVIRA